MPERLRIEIDRASLLELARGGNLYGERFACVRELLSNAADATLIRLFEERGAAAFPTHERSIADLRAALREWPIDVSLDVVGDASSGVFRLRIRDRGTGIAREDLPFLGTLGASHRNPRRRATVEAMPEWMRPTGAFGIGLHAAFLMADELCLRSTHARTGVSTSMRLFRDGDGVSIDIDDTPPLDGGGTEAEVEISRAAAAALAQLHGAGSHAARVRDWVLDPVPDAALLDLEAMVRAFAAGSIVPVRFGGAELPRAFDGHGAVFDPESGVEIAWIDDPERLARDWSSPPPRGPLASETFYRGAPLQHGDSRGFPLVVGFHFATARQVLGLSRDRFRAEVEDDVWARRRAAFFRIAPRWIDAADPIAAPERVQTSISRALWRGGGRAGARWREAMATTTSTGEGVTLGTLAHATEVRTEIVPLGTPRHRAVVGDTVLPIDDLMLAERELACLFPDGLLETWEPAEDPTRHRRIVWRWSRDGRRGATSTAFRALLGQALRTSTQPRRWTEVPEAYRELAVDLARIPVVPRVTVLGVGPKLVLALPYVARDGCVRVPEIAKWARFVVEHAPEPRDVRDVARAAWRFLVEHDPVVRAIPDVTVDVDLEALRRELETLGVVLSA